MGFCRKRLYYILDGAKCDFVTKFKNSSGREKINRKKRGRELYINRGYFA